MLKGSILVNFFKEIFFVKENIESLGILYLLKSNFHN